MNDVITKPVHYDGAHGIECKEAMSNMVDRVMGCKVKVDATPTTVYWWGCAFKYLWRWPFKNGLQDIDKCIECLENIRREIRKSVIDDGSI